MTSIRALRAEYRTMLAAERNGRRMKLDPIFFENPVWQARREWLRSILYPTPPTAAATPAMELEA